MSYSKSSAFSIKRAWPTTGWDHADFFPDSKSSILGLSNEVSFVTEYFWKYGENQENIFPL